LTGQVPIRIYPDSQTSFFANSHSAQLRFIVDEGGAVTAVALYQDGVERSGMRVSKSAAVEVTAAIDQQRLKDRPAHPGTEDSLRRYIQSLERRHPNYEEMSPPLAAAVNVQLPAIMETIHRMGDFKSLTYTGASSDGADVYIATFAEGQIEWRIWPLENGKVTKRGFSVLQ
jgi:hypothetical protein